MARYRIYGFDECKHCKLAIRYLEERGKSYDYVALNDQLSRVTFLNDRGFGEGERTFPRVYKVAKGSETLIGGRTDLYLHLNPI